MDNVNLFFMGGSARSGTTWAQKMLNGHPHINCNGEGHFIDCLGYALQNEVINPHIIQLEHHNRILYEGKQGYPVFNEQDAMMILKQSIMVLLAKQHEQKPAPVLGERTPNNIRHFHILQGLFPQAKFIEIIRDGRDVAVSGWNQGKRTAADWLKSEFDDDFDKYMKNAAELWVIDIEAGKAFEGPLCTVRYEELLENPSAGVSEMLEFLQVDGSDWPLDACIKAGGKEQMGGHYQNATSGQWKKKFNKDNEAAFLDIAGDLLTELGYL